MRKIILLLFAATLMLAEIKQAYATKKLVSSGIIIIDIRSHAEWKETGIVAGSKTITFYDENGNYNTEEFLKELNKYVTKDTEFALICRTGNRTKAIGQFLMDNGYKVINLKGGIRYLIDKEGYKTTPYKE